MGPALAQPSRTSGTHYSTSEGPRFSFHPILPPKMQGSWEGLAPAPRGWPTSLGTLSGPTQPRRERRQAL